MALAASPDHADALHLLGIIALQTRGAQEAVELLARAVAVNPGSADAHYHQGHALITLKRYAEALESYDRALALKPDADAYYLRGTALFQLKRYAEAVESFERALALKPDYAAAYDMRGVALFELKRHAEALESLARAVALKPGYAEAHYNRGIALFGLNRYAEAVESYDRALALKPDYADAHNNRGMALIELKRPAEAMESFERALQIKPDHEFVYGNWLHTKMQICAWDDISKAFAHLIEKIERREKAAPPFGVLATPSGLAVQRMAAEIWVQDKHPASHALSAIPRYPRHDKIRIGYFSADFREHAVSHLIAGLLERHDKSRFQLNAFSFGPDTNDATRARVAAAFDRFIDVRGQSDQDVAMLARQLEIDIAIDLNGFTQGSRTDIFAMRAAPIQVNYLGYPGTMGAEYIDYLVADATVIPEAHQRHYAERVAYLPNSYLANDPGLRISERAFTREELGLPRNGAVFCCFNNSYKITPGTFDGWMRILDRVEDSVLWLLEGNAHAVNNLRKEAARRGIDGSRLVFAPRVPIADHLARHRSADLFLDTLPYNAHTTAIDALWAGLPVLTRLGETFAGRVAASLLEAIRVPELITRTPEQYEGLAVALATNPDRLIEVKRKLAGNRLTAPLFDTRLLAKHIEAAYTAMYERYQTDLLADHIYVQA